jgi:hypothetical protein
MTKCWTMAAATLLVAGSALAQPPGQGAALTVKIDEVSLSDAVQVPTGENRMTGGRFQPVFEAKKPATGSTFLVVTATFQNAEAPIKLPRTEVVLNPAQAGGRTPVEWHEELSPLLMSMSVGDAGGGSLTIEKSTKVSMTFEVPLKWESLAMPLHVKGLAVGSVRVSPDAEVIAAARGGDTIALRRVLDAGGSANARTAGDGETALMLAAEKGHIEAVRVLLQRGADVNATASKMTRSIRADGAGLNVLDLEWTALSAAETNGHQAVVDLLKKSGAK